jgi:hypothetical protein
MMTALVEVATGRFIEDGSVSADGVAYVRVPVSENPDPARQRYSGDPEAPLADIPINEREADQVTPQVIADVPAVASDPVSVEAILGTVLWRQTGKQPDTAAISLEAERYDVMRKQIGG